MTKEQNALLAYKALCTKLVNDMLVVLEQLKTEQHVNPIASKVESILWRYKRRADRIDYEWTHTNANEGD